MPASRLVRSSILCAGLLAGILAADIASTKGKKVHHFKAKGTVTISDVGSCGSNTCYDISADLIDKHGNTSTLTGTGTNDTSTCHKKKGKICCTNTESGTVVTADGNIDEGFVGKGCTNKSDTKETLLGKLTITGGTGKYEGATGSGKLSATIDPKSGTGPISVSGVITW